MASVETANVEKVFIIENELLGLGNRVQERTG